MMYQGLCQPFYVLRSLASGTQVQGWPGFFFFSERSVHHVFSSQVSVATQCAFFWSGIAVEVLVYRQAQEWALGVLAQQEQFDATLWAIATADDRNSALDVLQTGAQGGDVQKAGQALLQWIAHALDAQHLPAADAVRAAMRVAQATSLHDRAYYDFEGLADELQRHTSELFGTPVEVVQDLRDMLEHYARPCVTPQVPVPPL